MIRYVWAVSPDHAIERAYACNDYEDLPEALRKKPAWSEVTHNLYKIEVTRWTHTLAEMYRPGDEVTK